MTKIFARFNAEKGPTYTSNAPARTICNVRGIHYCRYNFFLSLQKTRFVYIIEDRELSTYVLTRYSLNEKRSRYLNRSLVHRLLFYNYTYRAGFVRIKERKNANPLIRPSDF